MPDPIPCASCGADVMGLTVGTDCRVCGRPIVPGAKHYDRPLSGHAVASVVVASLGFLVWPLLIVLAPLAVVLASSAQAEYARGAVSPASHTLATVGSVLGKVGVLIIGIVIVVGTVILTIAGLSNAF